jgi:hypothetical protein
MKAMEDLTRHWDRTSGVWRDEARAEFEKIYLDELVLSVKGAANAMQRVRELLRRAEKECQ